MSLDEMSGKQEMVFTCRGEKVTTGPVTLEHLRQSRKILKQVADVDSDPGQEAEAVLLTLLFVDAGRIPAEITGWPERVSWVASQFTLAEISEADQVLSDATPAKLKPVDEQKKVEVTEEPQTPEEAAPAI